jgi:hypothetical protein
VVILIKMITTSNAQVQRGVMGVGVSAGATNYEGDLDDNFTLVFTRPGFGVHFIMLFFSRVHLRVNLFHGRITANDNQASFTDNKIRKLNFYSDIDEAGFNILYTLQNRKKGFTKRNLLAPYFFAGVAYYRFNPRRKVNGKVYNLRDIGTEGQFLPGNYPKPYQLQQFSIPFGIGFKLKITENFDIGAETGFRKTFTDYLDDVSTNYPDKALLLAQEGPDAVYLSDSSIDPSNPTGKPSFSQRGNPNNKDWYVYTNINITYYFTTTLFKPYKLKSSVKNNSCKGLMFK